MLALAPAKVIAYEIIEKLGHHFIVSQVCGSIRRERPFVNDIDLVVIPKTKYGFNEPTISDDIAKLDPNGLSESLEKGKTGKARFLDGDSIKRFFYKGIMIDIYFATQENFETLVLIRTGSTQHNIKLTTLAKSYGWKLFANGDGLWKVEGSGDNAKKIKLIADTEDGILNSLLNKVVTPQEREN